MKKLAIGLLAAMPLFVPTTAPAQERAMRSYETAAQVAPADGGAAIELANAYWRNGRTADAYDVYRRALKLNNVMLETKFGDSIWSHEVARRALAQQVTLTAR